MKRIGRGIASGKIILAGEHAVVYNHPAIALPFCNVKVETIVKQSNKNESWIQCFEYLGPLENLPESLLGIKEVIVNTLKHLNKSNDMIDIEIKSSIPTGSGLGSSASLCTSIVKGILDYYEIIIDTNLLFKLVEIGEKIFHHNPSGIDMYAINSDTGILFKNKDCYKNIDIDLDAYLVVAYSGIQGKTKDAIRAVKTLLKLNETLVQQAFNNIGLSVEQITKHLYQGDINCIGNHMTKIHNELKLLGVSNDTLDNLVNVALDNGALGAKLTGGGKGGCIIAIASSYEDAIKISRTLKSEGAFNTWEFSLKGDNYDNSKSTH